MAIPQFGIGESYIKQSGVYKRVKRMFQKLGGHYRAMLTLHIKDEDYYKSSHIDQQIPEGALCTFMIEPTRAGWYTLVDHGDRLIKLSHTLVGTGATGGSEQHGPHPASDGTDYTGYYSHPNSIDHRNLGSQGINSTASSHRHTIDEHSHPDAGDSWPQTMVLRNYLNVIKCDVGMIAYKPEDASAPLVGDGWSLYEPAATVFAHFDNTEVVGAESHDGYHSHGVESWTTSLYDSPTESQSYQRSSYWYEIHGHTIYESSWEFYLPQYEGFDAYICTKFGADFPVGCGILADESMDTLPEGWSVYQPVEDSFLALRATADPYQGGTPTEEHAHFEVSTSDPEYVHTYNGSTNREAESGSEERRVTTGHSHVWDHVHGATEATPPFVKLAMIIKE